MTNAIYQGKIIRHFILFLVERSLSFYTSTRHFCETSGLQFVTWGGVKLSK